MRAMRLVVPALSAAALSLSFASVAVAAPIPTTAPVPGGANGPVALESAKATFTPGCTADGKSVVTAVETNPNSTPMELAGMLMTVSGNAIAPVSFEARTVAPGQTVTYTLYATPGTYVAVAHFVGSNSIMDTKQVVTVGACTASQPAAQQPAKPAAAKQPNLANTGGHA